MAIPTTTLPPSESRPLKPPANPYSAPESEPSVNEREPVVATRKNLAQIALALLDQLFISLTTFVTMMLVAKLCDRPELNLYVLAWSILNFFRVLQERALAAPYVVFAHERDRESSAFLGSSLSYQGMFSIATSLAFVVLAVGFSIYQSPLGLAKCLWLVVLAAPFILLRDHLRAVSCTHFRYGVAALLSGSALTIQLLIMLACYQLGLLDASIVFAAMGVSSLIPALAWLKLQPEPFQLKREQLLADWQTTINYSRWLVVARFFPTAAYALLPWIVLWLVSDDAAGAFGSCLTLANVSMMFVIGSNNLFQPRAVRALHREGKQALTRILGASAIVYGVVLSVMCIIYFCFGSQLLTIIFDSSLAMYGNVVLLLGLHVLIVSFSIVAGNGMAALEKPTGIFWGELAWSIVTLAAAVLLTSLYGLTGTAVALCLGSLTAALVEVGFLIQLLQRHAEPPLGGVA